MPLHKEEEDLDEEEEDGDLAGPHWNRVQAVHLHPWLASTLGSGLYPHFTPGGSFTHAEDACEGEAASGDMLADHCRCACSRPEVAFLSSSCARVCAGVVTCVV